MSLTGQPDPPDRSLILSAGNQHEESPSSLTVQLPMKQEMEDVCTPLEKKKHSRTSCTMLQQRDGLHLHPSHQYALICSHLTWKP